MNTIYKAITETIKANAQEFIDASLQPIKHFDKYKGQVEEPEWHQPYETPAIFYQWSADWKSVTNYRQRGDIIIRLYIVLENFGESYDGSPDQDYALQLDDYYTLIHSIIQGLGGDTFTRLNRIRSEPAPSPYGETCTHIMIYQCQAIDDSADVFRKWNKNNLDDLEITSAAAKVNNLPNNLGDTTSGFLI